MDELAWSLFGVNYHYGTPSNPKAPTKIPGGSSSGSASAVADETVDIGIGTDTGGSVRIPAAYCGIYGIRPTQGAVSLQGARALAPSFDTCGWFARSMHVMAKVGDILLLDQPSNQKRLSTWLVASDAFDLADAQVQETIYKAVAQSKEELMRCIGEGKGEGPEEVLLDKYNTNFDEWFKAFRVLQSREVWKELGEWVTQHKPTFGPGIKERFEYAQTIQDKEVEEANKIRSDLRAHMLEIMGEGGVLMLPTAPGPPPTSAESPEVVTDIRGRILRLTSIAGLTGFPQVSIPIGEVEGEGPIGLSLMGPPGSDKELLDMCTKVDRILQQR
jgi:amidase